MNPSTKFRFPASQSARTWIVLAAAIGLGLTAAAIARQYLSNRVAEIESEANARMTQVIVAKRALGKGDILSADNLAVRAIPTDYMHVTAVRPEEFGHIDGERLGFGVASGEAILWGLLETKRAPTFSAHVGDGRRAVTVPVDEINSISGLLEPGDVIDLVVALDQQGRKSALPFLLGVRVIATGQRSVDDPRTGETREYQTVTLDTTPEEARNLVLAREAGRITALLRNPQDLRREEGGQDLAHALYGRGRTGTGRSKTRAEVPVLYGGAQLPAEGLRLRSPAPPEQGVAPEDKASE